MPIVWYNFSAISSIIWRGAAPLTFEERHMSAVAAAEIPSVGPVLTVAGHAPVSELEREAAEQKRWMTWFGLPALVASLFVGLVFATGQEWYLGLAISAIVTDIGVLVWLAMSSDTNGLLGDTPRPGH
jgi:hypothetical protein